MNIHTAFKYYESLCNQRARLLNDLTFLMRRRDSKIIPKGLKMKCKSNTYSCKRIMKHTGISLVKEQIHAVDERTTCEC